VPQQKLCDMDINKIRGIAVSGKMLSGKGAFLDVFQYIIDSKKVTNLAFADKLKLYAKELLCIVSQHGDSVTEPLRPFATKMSEELFGGLHYGQVYDNMLALARLDCTKEYAKPGITMPDTSQEFGFEDIDALLFADCGKPRKMLQLLGTEYVRSIVDGAWVDYAFKIANKHRDYFFVVTDARFPNEMTAAEQNDFLNVRVEASKEVRLKRGFERDGQDYTHHLMHASETALDDHVFPVVIQNNGTLEDFTAALWDNPALASLIDVVKRRMARAEFVTSN